MEKKCGDRIHRQGKQFLAKWFCSGFLLSHMKMIDLLQNWQFNVVCHQLWLADEEHIAQQTPRHTIAYLGSLGKGICCLMDWQKLSPVFPRACGQNDFSNKGHYISVDSTLITMAFSLIEKHVQETRTYDITWTIIVWFFLITTHYCTLSVFQNMIRTLAFKYCPKIYLYIE